MSDTNEHWGRWLVAGEDAPAALAWLRHQESWEQRLAQLERCSRRPDFAGRVVPAVASPALLAAS